MRNINTSLDTKTINGENTKGETRDGIYSDSDRVYGTYYLKFGNTFCKQIPSRLINPDAMHLAQLFLLRDFHGSMMYNETTSELEIISSFFPNILGAFALLTNHIKNSFAF